jgi:hypothetical protein
MSSAIRNFYIASVLGALGLSPVFGQAPGVAIESQQPLMNNPKLLAQAGRLREADALLKEDKVAEQLSRPSGGPIELAEPSRRPLSGRELAARAREAYVRLGWYYRCKRCDKWHLDAAGSYAIAPDALATCYHCLQPKAEMKEGFLIAIDAKEKVHAIQSVLAGSRSMDCAIVRVSDGGLTPLALQDDVAPGDKVSCFSEPLGQHGYFTTGIVNRFYWNQGKRGEAGSLDELKSLRVNVSTDWAPGSSGAAVLDEFGNVIGHVSRIATLTRGGQAQTPPPTNESAGDEKTTEVKHPAPVADPVMITLHEAVPARSVRALAIKATQTTPKATESKPATETAEPVAAGEAPAAR